MASQFLGEHPSRNAQHQTAVIPRQLQFSVALRVLRNFNLDMTRHIVLREPAQLLADRFDRHAGGTRVPDGERRDAIRVNMLGRLHQFGKTRERIPRLDIARTVDLDQNRVVTLHYEGIFVSSEGHAFSLSLALQYCDFKSECLAALNKVAWIRLLLDKEINRRRPRFQ